MAGDPGIVQKYVGSVDCNASNNFEEIEEERMRVRGSNEEYASNRLLYATRHLQGPQIGSFGV